MDVSEVSFVESLTLGTSQKVQGMKPTVAIYPFQICLP